eukprot:4576413-Alexandrium_andersonii.AAC.1
MSASLVGSEMCIRDSSSCPGSSRSVSCPRASAPGPGAASHPGTTAAAVSYTHLTLPTICSV